MGQFVSKIKSQLHGEDQIKTRKYLKPKKPTQVLYRNVRTVQDSVSLHSTMLYNPSPRAALKRTYSPGIDTSVPDTISNIFKPKKQKKCISIKNYPFLNDDLTINYYSHSKVMLILRGLPGSGKSTLAEEISRKFPFSTVCSADSYFMNNGRYQFNGKLIKEAHAQCKIQALNSVQTQIPLIIIDNTNLQLWEINFYLRLSKAYNYIPVIVEPNTEWNRIPATLAAKNIHGLNTNMITQKLAKYQALKPTYYGWFLNEVDSHIIFEESLDVVRQLFEIGHFNEDISIRNNITSMKDFLEYFKNSKKMLHCTARYIGKETSESTQKYLERSLVAASLGTVSSLKIVGYVITPRTFAARVQLNNQQMNLWGADDFEIIPDTFWTEGDRVTSLPKSCSTNPTASESSQSNVDTDSQNQFCPLDPTTLKYYQSNNDSEPQMPTALQNCESIVKEILTSQDDPMGVLDMHELNSPDSSFTLVLPRMPLRTELNSDLELDTTVDQWMNVKDYKEDKLNSSDKYYKTKRKCKVKIPASALSITESTVRKTISYSKCDTETRLIEGKGSKAHFTLASAPNIKATTTGLDAIFTARNEDYLFDSQQKLKERLPPNISKYEFPSFVARHFSNGLWVMYLKKAVSVNAIFNTFNAPE